TAFALEIETFARCCGNVTVLFCDVADFPQLVAALTPKQLISMMHRLFSCIDKLVFIHALTKLETVSESYVVCSGLNPDDNTDDRIVSTDAFRAVLLGLDILDNTASMNISVDRGFEDPEGNSSITLVMKIGIHTGPVISGVVGTKRPQFCIFGDTINTASRMKSTAIPNRVHLSSSTRECLEFSSSLSFEEREAFIKGKGMLVTYDATRTFGSPHTRDAGVMSPRVLRTKPSAASLDMANVDKPRRVEPFKRTSQTSTRASSSTTLASSARGLLAILKRISWWRARAERSFGDRAEGSSPPAADPSSGRKEGWGDISFDLDKSRDLRIAVEALRRHSELHGA
ncbi:hypothetical protein FOZ62_009623, partial [Perkinsus olseni]